MGPRSKHRGRREAAQRMRSDQQLNAFIENENSSSCRDASQTGRCQQHNLTQMLAVSVFIDLVAPPRCLTVAAVRLSQTVTDWRQVACQQAKGQPRG